MRDGSPNEASPTELEGMFTEVTFKQLHRVVDGQKVFTNSTEMINLMRMNNDLKLESAERRYNKHHPHSPITVSRIEDIPMSQMKYEVEDLIKSLKLNNVNSFKSHNKKFQSQRMFADMDEDSDGDLIQENELLLDKQITPFELEAREIDTLRDRAAFLIKKLHEESKKRKYHMISYIIALAIAKERGISYIAPRDIYGDQNIKVFEMFTDGSIGKRLILNNHFGAVPVRWIRGLDGKDIFFEYAEELIHISNHLQCPLSKEDPADYNEESIDEIVNTYIENNRTYLTKIRHTVHAETYSSIKNIDLGSYNKTAEITEKKPLDILDNCIQTAYMYEASKDMDLKGIQSANVFANLEYLLELYNAYPLNRKVVVNTARLTTSYGFYCTSQTEFLVLNLGHYKTRDRDPGNSKCIIHKDGAVIRLLDGTDTLEYAYIQDLVYDARATLDYFNGQTNYLPESFGKNWNPR